MLAMLISVNESERIMRQAYTREDRTLDILARIAEFRAFLSTYPLRLIVSNRDELIEMADALRGQAKTLPVPERRAAERLLDPTPLLER